jgi:hypothetical protein
MYRSVVDDIADMDDEIETLKAAKSELLEALKPFAESDKGTQLLEKMGWLAEEYQQAKAVYEKYKPVEKGDENG